MKKLCAFLLLFIFVGCSDEDNTPIETPPNSLEISIDIGELDSLDYSNITALSIDSENPVSSNGVFENPYTYNGIEDLPVLFVENEELLFGYFPHTLSSNEITIDDIVLFYYMMYPQIAIQGISHEDLRNSLASNQNYNDIKEVVVQSLNNNESAYNNETFIDNLRSFAADLTDENAIGDTNEIVGQFQFVFERDGLIKWEQEAPLFSALGIVITDEDTDEVIFGPKVLKTKNLELSASSIVSFIKENITGESETPLSSFQLNEEGAYNILVSNGYSSNEILNDKVNAANINQFANTALALVITNTFKTLAGNNECWEAIAGLHAQIINYATNLIISGTAPTADSLINQLKSFGLALGEVTNECVTGNGFKKFIKIVIGLTGGLLNNALDISELIFLMRDYFSSDILFNEARYFDNEVSFGELQQELISVNEFSGASGDNFLYQSEVKEKIIGYDVDRSLTESSFIANESFVVAKDLPFKTEILFGDITIEQNNPIFTNAMGELNVNFIMNDFESEVLISPDFETEFLENQTLTFDKSIFGTWNISATECDGTDIEYTGLITLNNDFTVTQEDDSSGNYITNYFTFEDNVLFIKTEYMDPTCDGTESRFQSDTVTLIYDSETDTFSGTGNTTKESVDLPDCQRPPYNCNYNVTLSR